MTDTRITGLSTTYDRDDYSRTVDYLIGDRSGGSSFRILAEEAVLGVLESVTGNVGIGTTSPATPVHVAGAHVSGKGLLYLKSSDAGFMSIDAASGQNTGIILKEGDVQRWVLRNNGAGDDFEIQDQSGTARVTIEQAGNVGIGTTSPTAPLHVAATTGGANYDLFTITASEGGGYDFRDLSTTGFLPSFIMTSSGISGYGGFIAGYLPSASDSTVAGGAAIVLDARKDGTGAVSAANVLAVKSYTSTYLVVSAAGNTHPGADNTYDIGTASFRWDDVYATNGTIQTSDRRLKSAIADSDLGLEFVNALRPVSFRREGGTRKHYGLIAQEVETALNGRDFAGLIYDKASDRYGMRYDELIAPLITAVQELSQQVTALTQRVTELEQGAA